MSKASWDDTWSTSIQRDLHKRTVCVVYICIYIYIYMYIYQSAWADIGRYVRYVYEEEPTEKNYLRGIYIFVYIYMYTSESAWAAIARYVVYIYTEGPTQENCMCGTYIYIYICIYIYESSWADIGRYLLYIYEKEPTKETYMKRDLLALSLKPQLLKRDLYKRKETDIFQNRPTTGTHMYKERPTCIRETYVYEKRPTSIKETHKRDLHLEKYSYRKDLHLCRKKALYTRSIRSI